MEAKLLKPTTDVELKKWHSREEVLIARGRKEVVEWLNDYVPMFCRDDKKWQVQKKIWLK